jgi:hypothetical protein
MKNRGDKSTAGSKAHGSDDEDSAEIQTSAIDDKLGKQVAVADHISQEEIERRQLEHAPVIADSEISPAAYLFHNQEEQDDLNLFE